MSDRTVVTGLNLALIAAMTCGIGSNIDILAPPPTAPPFPMNHPVVRETRKSFRRRVGSKKKQHSIKGVRP